MKSNQYPKVPTTRGQLMTTIFVILICTVALFALNPDLHLGESTRRAMNRSGLLIMLVATILGGFGLLWGARNKRKLSLEERDIAECTEMLRRIAGGQQDCAAVEHVLAEVRWKLACAEAAKVETSNFDVTVANLGICALVVAGVGTVVLALAA